MLRTGYYNGNGNSSLTKSCDFEYAYQNFYSPMYDDVRSIVKTIDY